MKARDVKPVAGARHRHVKKPPLLAQIAGLDGLLGVRDGAQSAGSLDGPDRDGGRAAVIVQEEDRNRRGALVAARIGQDDDVRFEALGAVHRHDADLARRLIRLALHLGGAFAREGNELREACQRPGAEGLGQGQELVDGVEAFRPEPRAERLAAALRFQNMRVEIERAELPRQLAPAGQLVRHRLL